MSSGRQAVLAALGANVAVASTKFVGFVLTGSSALLAETLHSLADSGNQVLLLFGARKASETPSVEHPFGRGRERYFWAFVVGLVLFGLGGVFSMYEGISKLTSADHELTSPGVGVGLILVAIVFEGLSLRTAIGEANHIREPGDSAWRFIRSTRNPEVAVVLLEDGAALVGLAFALVGVGMSWITGNPLWDAAATVGIGMLLCGVAAVLTNEMKSLLIGETIPAWQSQQMEEAIAAVDGVLHVLNVRTEHLGPEQVLVCVKIALAEPANLSDVIAIIDQVEAVVALLVPDMLTCYVEPDAYDPERIGSDWT